MARIDVESFKEGIKKCNEMIIKWEAKKEKLENKIENTIQCPKCKQYWDKLYIRRKFMKYDYSKGGYFGDEIHRHCRSMVELQCPFCQTPFSKQIHWHCDEHPTNTEIKEETEFEFGVNEFMWDVVKNEIVKAKN